MIARIWRGATKADRAQDYLEYLRGTGIADYAATPGNHGVEVLLRTEGDRTQFTLITYWESLEAIKRFAGDQPEVARFYPEDDDYLIDRELTVEHHESPRSGALAAEARPQRLHVVHVVAACRRTCRGRGRTAGPGSSPRSPRSRRRRSRRAAA